LSLSKRFGGVSALEDVSLTLAKGEAIGVIGPNGAGKSTLLKLISGELRPDQGTISLNGKRIDGRPIHRVARAGVVLAHQMPQPFASQTVCQNLLVARRRSAPHGHVDTNELLERCGLTAKADTPARHLNLLDLKRLEVARALATDPTVLLLDEVAAGLNGRDLDHAIELIHELHLSGIGLLVVEHIERVIRELVSRVLVLDWGRLIAAGTPAEIAAHDDVRAVYLGARTVAKSGQKAERPRPAPVLDVRGVSARYGDVQALSGVDMQIGEGEVVAVLGANGAGKSTLASVISGQVPLSAGSLRMDGRDLDGTPAHIRARQGIAHCPEGRHVFAELTVLENLTIALPLRIGSGEISERLGRVHEIFPKLNERGGQLAGTLSGGEQQMLSVGRALMTKPTLLICDELSLGLAPIMIDTIYEALRQIAAQGVMLILIEQDITRCLDIADWVYVLLRGEPSYSGGPARLADENFLDNVYFGRETTK
jgi:branched-chain amino acid transport system ATP-binding protein